MRKLFFLMTVLTAATHLPVHAQEPDTEMQTYTLTDEGLLPVQAPASQLDMTRSMLQDIQQLIAQDRNNDAIRQLERFTAEHPDSELYAHALLLYGDAWLLKNNPYEALYHYEQIATEFPATPTFLVVLEREYDVAEMFLQGWKKRFLGMRLIGMEEEGIELLIRIQERLPGSALGEKASLRIGDWYYGEENWELAIEAYDIFRLNYPQSSHDKTVVENLIAASLARYNGPDFDAVSLRETRQRIYEYQMIYPEAAAASGAIETLVEIEKNLAEALFNTSTWYKKRSETRSEVFILKRIIESYPNTAVATDAKARLEEIGEDT